MFNRISAAAVRILSLLVIGISAVFFTRVKELPVFAHAETFQGSSGKAYENETIQFDRTRTGFSRSLHTLFPRPARQAEAVKAETPKEQKKVTPPDLTFVGMIETGTKTVYSFRNNKTHTLLLLKKGIEVHGLTLIRCRENVCIIKKEGMIFQVEKE